MVSRPLDSEYAPSFSPYVGLVQENDPLPVLVHQLEEFSTLSSLVPAEKERFRYAPGKWSIREVFGHMIDGERVFGYRAFCISRGEIASLPSFDENLYVERSGYDGRSLKDLVEEFHAVRSGNLSFLKPLDEKTWKQMGTANNLQISVRALVFIMIGHVRHHFDGLRVRYGVVVRS